MRVCACLCVCLASRWNIHSIYCILRNLKHDVSGSRLCTIASDQEASMKTVSASVCVNYIGSLVNFRHVPYITGPMARC